MRRVLSALALLGLLMTTLFFTQGAASAAPYPPPVTTSLSVSSNTPCAGQSIKVGGSGFGATEAVTLSIGGTVVGSATTDAAGSFDPDVTTPNLIGGQNLTGLGQTSGRTASLTITIRDCAGAGASGGGGGGGGGGLASTGVKIAGLGLLAALLLSGGMFFVIAGRRRASAHS